MKELMLEGVISAIDHKTASIRAKYNARDQGTKCRKESSVSVLLPRGWIQEIKYM
jgi:hypothetical protein